ncbi:MAG: hypothetical protein EOO53_18340 [Gammaproteobacteria bacterium]|nr:MAG: hypothetical protein EOO53_18340 [Gammaproteobacteria bacterium]
MKTSKISALKAKFQTARKSTLPVLFVLSCLSANALAMGRNDAPCTFGDDCVATIYYHICNRLCFWY